MIACFGGNTGSVNMTPTGGTAPYTYVWTGGSTAQSAIGVPAGTYTVTVTDANGCKGNDAIDILVLNSPYVNAGSDKIVCEYNFPITLVATGNGVLVEWSTGDESPFTTINSPGNYTVTTTAQNGCQAIDDVTITSDACLGVNELNQSVNIFPNPTNSSISIIASFSLPTTYLLLTIDGKILKDLIKENILEKFDHKNLNLDTIEFKNLNPSAENIAIVIYNILREKIEMKFDLQVRLYETPRNFVEYPVN
jgi:hypothetical protein